MRCCLLLGGCSVDMSVASNFVYGVSRAALAGVGGNGNGTGALPAWFDSGLQQMVQDTAGVVAWSIASGATERRPDIALMYYPPVCKWGEEEHQWLWLFVLTWFPCLAAPQTTWCGSRRAP